VAVKNAFASYASKDRRRILAHLHGMEKIGVKVFMGVRNVKPNDPYPLDLLKHIDDADVLYLFWSRDAQNSDWVEREWRYGKARKGVAFIDPVPLADPRLVSPPEQLGDQNHFDDWVVAYREAVKGANAWRRFVAWAAGDG
jgi:TIR domain